MLIDLPPQPSDPVADIIATINGNAPGMFELRPGIYRIGHFGGTGFLREFEHYPNFSDNRGAYGVCDNIEQLLTNYPELEYSDREFVVTVNTVRRDKQPEHGGWRWHKWGEYIGIQNSQCEYLYDEPTVEEVMVYHIYERIDYNAMSTNELREAYRNRYFCNFDSGDRRWQGDSEGAVRGVLLKIFQG